MSDKFASFGICRCLSSLALLSCFYVYIVNSQNTIVSKMELNSNCVDGSLTVRSHGDEWTSSSGACDRHVCYSNISNGAGTKYKVSYECPSGSTIHDTSNCQSVTNTTLTFPGCCPTVVCSVGVLPNNTPAACSDLSPSFACEFWKNTTQCTTSTSSFLQFIYNLTVEYCRLTCGGSPSRQTCKRVDGCFTQSLWTVKNTGSYSILYRLGIA